MNSSLHKPLTRQNTGLLVVDMQDKLFNHVDRPCEVLLGVQKVIKGFQILQLPIVVTEQYPQGLGPTIETLKSCLGENQTYLPKTCFSCLGDQKIEEEVLNLPVDSWVIVGIEAHVCVLQTARDLIQQGKAVVVLNDCITSRSVFDFSTAIAELRDMGARISSAETVLFELVKDAKAPEFREISQLVK